MNNSFTKGFFGRKLIQGSLTLSLLLLAQFTLAHSVSGYTAACNTGPTYSIDPIVQNVNSGSNYAWQYKNSSGTWVCIANGNNTINGNTYNVTGARYNQTTNPGPIIFTNPTSGLNGLIIRCVISDGSGVNPCNTPSGNTWNSDGSSVNHTINVSNSPCGTPNLKLGNRVWYDTDGDGINDASENGIESVSVKLYKDDNNDNVADGASIATDVTDNDGYYGFSNLAAGNYIVGIVIPKGYMSSGVDGGDPDDNTNLDDNGQVFSGDEVRGLAITLSQGGETENSGYTNNTYDFGLLPDCDCANSTGNKLVNGSFENGTTGWSWSGGNVTTGTGFIACGTKNGFLDQTSGTAKIWQDVAVTSGATVTFSAFAGTHTGGIGCSPKITLIFLSASNAVLAQHDVTVTRDVDVNFNQLAEYSITAVAPSGTAKVRAQGSITCNTLKMDAFCLTITGPASLGDRVWKDDNSDGIQNNGEVGVAGVTLALLNSSGTVIATTTTDAMGMYKFANLAPGNYSVRVTPPANYSLSAKDQGGDDNADSDFDQTSYTTGSYTLVAGQNRTDVDAGLKFSQPSTASVGDRVWLDTDADGVQDANEPGVSNVLVTLYNSSNTAIRSTFTNVSGNYIFTDVAPGSYTVGFSLPPGMVFSPNTGAVSVATNSDAVPSTGKSAAFTVVAGDQITYVDAGIRTQQIANGSVGDYVWNDLDKDGTKELGEPGIPNVTVRLVNANTSAVIATTTTNAVGKYIFNDVAPGDYLVEFVTPAGYTTTTRLSPNAVSSGTDSDVNSATGRTGVFSLGTGQRITTIDAGYWITTSTGTAKLGDRVWYDVDQDGIQDANEPSVPGITVILYNSAGTAIAQKTTDQNGNYYFTDLAAGSYSVGFSNLPVGFTFTTQGLGTAATGSDANPATGRTAAITLTAGQTNLDVDAGIKQAQAGTASLGNKIWYDLNNNGLQEAGELGVQGVTVELLDAAGNAIDKDPITAGVQPTVAITNGLGEYLFTGLAAGEYRVRFSTTPAGYTIVIKNSGANRDVDSDGNPLSGGTSTSDVITLAINQERLDIDLGLFNATAPLGQLGDRVWFDTDNDGVQDATEQGVPGVSVALLDAAGVAIRTTVTDKEGIYKFINLANGTYSVQFSNLPAGFAFSAADQGGNDNTDSDADPVTGITTGTYTISGNTNLTADAGIFSTRAALGDYVWMDTDSDGIQDATESGIPGVTVTLYNSAGTAVASTITDQSGRYFFSNLTAGNYTVGFTTIPQQLTFTLRDVAAAGDAADSDVDPATGRTGTITLAAGQVNLTVDAGLRPYIPASVGDFVWNDKNSDGLQKADEPGVAGIIVTLYNSANVPIGSAVTDGDGFYLITNVPAGTGYYLVFSNKPGANAPWTQQNVGGATAANNSKVNSAGTSNTFSIAEGENNRIMDAGLVLPSSLPVRLISFTGQLAGSTAMLQWSTAQEQNTSHFDVEFSTDGLNFSKVGNSVIARGTSSVRTDYNFADNLSRVTVSKVYYRLKVVDRNGIVEYTNIIVIRLGDVKITSIYPNPFTDVIRLETDNKVREMARVNLYDVAGKVVMSKQQIVEVGGNLITISGLQKLPQGAYTIELSTDSGVKIAQKLIKQ